MQLLLTVLPHIRLWGPYEASAAHTIYINKIIDFFLALVSSKSLCLYLKQQKYKEIYKKYFFLENKEDFKTFALFLE